MATAGRDPRRTGALALLCTAEFMVILDAQVVVLALPSIARDLGFTLAGAQWVLSAYLLSFGGLLLLGGRTADLVGRRRLFMAGTGLFLLASLACGLAWTGAVLIGARVLQGVAAAMMAPSALAILTATFAEGPERNRALAVLSATGGFGATAALLIGGALTGAGWEWIFFLNVPVAVGMLAWSPLLLSESIDRERPRAYDPAGAIIVTVALAVGVYAVVEAPGAGWSEPRVVALFAVAAVLMGLFVLIESRAIAPLVPLPVLRSSSLSGGSLLVAVMAMIAFGVSFLVAQYAQGVLGFTPLMFGLATVVMPVMAVAGSYAAHALLAKIGYRLVAAAGVGLLGSGGLLLARISAASGYVDVLLPGLAVFGLGLGSGFTAARAGALSGIADRDTGLAAGLTSSAFQIGGALGVAILSTVGAATTAGASPSAPSDLALTEGIRAGFLVAFVLAVLGLLVATLLPGRRASAAHTGLLDHVLDPHG